MIKVVITTNSAPCRNAVALLDKLGLEYELVKARESEFDKALFYKMLGANVAEEGIYSFIAERSTIYKKLVDNGVDFDALSISELYSLLKEHPKLGTYPFIFDEDRDVVSTGYSENLLRAAVIPRKQRVLERIALYASTEMARINNEVDTRILLENENTYEQQEIVPA